MSTSKQAAVTAATRTFENLRGTRHGEVCILTKTQNGASAECYNTLGLVPQFTDEEWQALTPENVLAVHGGDKVWFNGPRIAIMDKATGEDLGGGKMTTFGGIQMYKVATLELTDMSIVSRKNKPYADQLVKRKTTWVFLAGRTVFELVAPDGKVYVMQSLSRHIDPNMNLEQLPTLQTRLHLPEGWQYRVRNLEKDLVVEAHMDAHIVLDEYENNYQLANVSR